MKLQDNPVNKVIIDSSLETQKFKHNRLIFFPRSTVESGFTLF